jgi:hypothetical protein
MSSSILSGVRSLVTGSLAELGLKEYLNRRYSSVGKVLSLKIDKTARKVCIELELNGESQPVQVTIERYELIETNDGLFLEIKELSSSRAWLTSLAPLLLKDKKFPLPKIARTVLA